MSDQTSTPMQLVEAGVAGADTGTTTGVGAAATDPLHDPLTSQTNCQSCVLPMAWEWATPGSYPA